MTVRRLLALQVAIGLAVSATDAAIVAYEFSGELRNVTDPAGHFGGARTFTGSFSYDTDTPDTNRDPNEGEYVGLSLVMQFEDTVIAAPTVGLEIHNDEPVPGEPWNIWDRIVVRGVGETPAGVNLQYFGLGMMEESGFWIEDDSLPLALDWGQMQDIDDNAEISVGLNFPDGESAYATGWITTLTPEPAAGLMLVVATLFRRRSS